MPVKFTGDWAVAVRLCASAPSLFPRATDYSLRRIGLTIVDDIKRNVKAGPDPQQNRLTKLTGGSGKPLNRNGDLGNSPNLVRVGIGEYFVGVPRTSGAFNIAVIHEQGAIIIQEMTPRMRRFLHAKLRDAGPPPNSPVGFAVSQIPARPFVGPALSKARSTFRAEFVRFFSHALRGEYGRA